MGHRSKGRSLALQLLYQNQVSGDEPVHTLDMLKRWPGGKFSSRQIKHAAELFMSVYRERQELDARISPHLQNYKLVRLNVVDLNIMRISIWEMLNDDDVPVRVAINEAIELARGFSSNDAPSFVNGVLDSFLREHPELDSSRDDTVDNPIIEELMEEVEGDDDGELDDLLIDQPLETGEDDEEDDDDDGSDEDIDLDDDDDELDDQPIDQSHETGENEAGKNEDDDHGTESDKGVDLDEDEVHMDSDIKDEDLSDAEDSIDYDADGESGDDLPGLSGDDVPGDFRTVDDDDPQYMLFDV
jgi:transcription antitermination protein NusB